MATDDREHWDDRYRGVAVPRAITPPELVETELSDFRERKLVLDVACGLGDAGLYLASLGADVTLADVSPIALDIASKRAGAADMTVTTATTDFDEDPLPAGPWDVIICVHFLDRALLPRLGEQLAVGGQLVVAIATTTNLERHTRPSARFLLEPNELPDLVPDLRVLRHDEAWRSNDVHEAWLVARTVDPAVLP